MKILNSPSASPTPPATNTGGNTNPGGGNTPSASAQPSASPSPSSNLLAGDPVRQLHGRRMAGGSPTPTPSASGEFYANHSKNRLTELPGIRRSVPTAARPRDPRIAGPRGLQATAFG